jgi:hypothetical protein
MLAALPLAARADLGVMVADPTNLGSARYTTAGHSLIYLSGVCAASPVRARLCEVGEQGSVVTMYPNFREDKPYSWNLVPLSVYLQGLPTPGDRLLYASKAVKEAMEAHAREGLFREVCAGGQCPTLPHSYWRDMVAATADRDIFLYAVHTSRAQDQMVVDWLNRDVNVNHYNALKHNCADFTRLLVDAIFPSSVHRDVLNDVGMMTPKAAAHSFTVWALKHPELGFYSLHFAQQPGDILRGGLARNGTETVIHMKKYLIPVVVLGDFELPTSIFAAYILTGRFGLYKESVRYSAPSVAGLEQDERTAKKEGDEERRASLELAAKRAQTGVTGSPQEWADYRERFAAIESSEEAQSLTTDGKRLFPKEYDSRSVSVDGEGRPWLTFDDEGLGRRVGLTSENVMASESDAGAAFQLMLGRVGYALRAKGRMCETMEEFREDWLLLEQTQDRVRVEREMREKQQPKVASFRP